MARQYVKLCYAFALLVENNVTNPTKCETAKEQSASRKSLPHLMMSNDASTYMSAAEELSNQVRDHILSLLMILQLILHQQEKFGSVSQKFCMTVQQPQILMEEIF